MAAGDQATQGAEASAASLLTRFTRNNAVLNTNG